MVDQRALVSLPSNLPMMLATPSNSSMVMTGKVAPLKSAKTALLDPAQDSGVVVDSAAPPVVDFGGGFGGRGGGFGARGGFGGGFGGARGGGGFGGGYQGAGSFDGGAGAVAAVPNAFTDYATSGTDRSEIDLRSQCKSTCYSRLSGSLAY